MLSEHVGDGWLRTYTNTDIIAWVSRGNVKFRDPVTGGGLFYLGSEADWLRAPLPLICGRENNRWFARVKGAPAEINYSTEAAVPQETSKDGAS
jgi:hypothetical protein